MTETYRLVHYEDLKEGEPVLAFGVHVLRWDFAQMGQPKYAFVPNEDAAPELLEACKAILPYLPTKAEMLDAASLNDGRAGEFDVAAMKIRDAIRKAEQA